MASKVASRASFIAENMLSHLMNTSLYEIVSEGRTRESGLRARGPDV